MKSGAFPVIVDLHTHLKHLDHYDMKRVWQEAVPARIAGEDTLILKPEDCLVYLISHQTISHGYVQKKWIKDIDLLIRHGAPTLNWQTVLQRIRENAMEVPAYFIFEKSQKIFQTPIADFILSSLQIKAAKGLQARLFRAMIVEEKYIPFVEYLLPVVVRPGIIPKLRFICKSIFPSKETLKKRYQISHSVWIPLFYLWRMVSLAGQAFAGMFLSALKVFSKKAR